MTAHPPAGRGNLIAMAPGERPDRPDRAVLQRAFAIASHTGQACRPVHLLAALAELDGLIGAALRSPDGATAWSAPTAPPKHLGGSASYLCIQTQYAASLFADEHGQPTGPAHLLVAVIDQAEPEAMAAITGAGLDPAEIRAAALTVLGLPADLAPITIPPPFPAGTHDRPPLAEDELDPRAWAVLTWRQAHLPLDALRDRRDWDYLSALEGEAAHRLYRQLLLDEDHQFSLWHRHLDRVYAIARQARPDVVPPPPEPTEPRGPTPLFLSMSHRRRHWQSGWLNFTVGWGTWFHNRWAGIRHRWFWLHTRRFAWRTRAAYRGAPTPD